MKLAPALAFPIIVETLSGSEGQKEGNPYSILGAWSNIHTLPFPPGSFREFLTFAEGGVFHETNSFLYTTSNLNFSAFGLPSAINASDGVGNWKQSRRGEVAATFRKMLFDGAGVNFGDLYVTGTLRLEGDTLQANWHIEVLDVSSNSVLTDFGVATSQGKRID